MLEEKVVYLHRFAENSSRDLREIQLNLFDFSKVEVPKIVIIDPDEINQDILFNLIVKNGFQSILDLRPRPVFQRPLYSHKKTTGFFFDNKVEYREIAILVQRSKGKLSAFRDFLFTCFGDGSYSPRFTLCLADMKAREQGIVAQFRTVMRLIDASVIEVSPRSILR